MKISSLFFFLVLVSALCAQTEPVKIQTTEKGSLPDSDITLRGTPINTSRSNIKTLSLWIDEWEAQLNAEAAARTSNLNASKSNINRQMGVPVNCSRSNIKTLSKKMDDVEKSDAAQRSAALEDMNKALAELNTCITALYDSIVSRGEAYAAKAAELKTRHDTVKNSIGNIR